MSEYAQSFVAHLEQLNQRDRGALAALRRSLAFEPGAYPPAYPFVERFVSPERHARDASRLALYIVAGLYALHPHHGGKSLASSLGALVRERESGSIEQRFIALLGADAENVAVYLRQIVSLLGDERPLDYALLLRDLTVWLSPFDSERRDRVRQRWARDFYRATAVEARPADAISTSAND